MSSTNDTIPKSVLDHYQHVQQLDEKLFLAIQVTGGQILLPIFVLTILFSKKVTRNVVFVNFCMSWIFSSIIYSLLVYRGRSTDDLLSLNPSADTCLIQTGLINGVQAFTSVSYLSLVIYLWVLLSSNAKQESGRTALSKKLLRHEVLFPIALLSVPFAAFVAFLITSIVIGSPQAINQNTDSPIPDSNLAIPGVFYCVILQNGNFSASETLTTGLFFLRVVYVFSVIMVFLTFMVEIWVAFQVYRKRIELRDTLKGHNGAWSSMFLRIIVFGIYRFLALGLNLALVLKPDEILLTGISRDNLFNGAIDYVQAAIPLVAFVVFATEKDVFDTWRSWIRSVALKMYLVKRPGINQDEMAGTASSSMGIVPVTITKEEPSHAIQV